MSASRRLVLVLACAWLSAALPAQAVMLVVNTTDDTSDGACSLNHCSLRDAIDAANTQPGPDTINFAIPADDPGCDAGGVCTIEPNDALPVLTDANTLIDGFTQPGAVANTTSTGSPINAVWNVVLQGSRLDECCSPGLHSRGRNARIRGLRVQGFYDGIYVEDAEGDRIEGVAALNNHCVGVLLSGVEGGSGAISNVIGGVSPDTRNLISGNHCVGVGIGPGRFNTVVGNVIGLDVAGTAGLGNAEDGIRVFAASIANRIGGANENEANTIAFNSESGVHIDGQFGATRNSILGNRIYQNQDGAILLRNGANANIAPPSIDDIDAMRVGGHACATCSVEVFSDGDDQARFFEGRTTADVSGAWVLDLTHTFRGPFITATETDALGDTSELSAPVRWLAATPSPTRTATPRRSVTATPPARTPTPGPCVGDCDASGSVTVDDIIRAVNVALDNLPLATCQSIDIDLNGAATIDEIILAVNSALLGCE